MPASQLQIKISLYPHREPDLHAYFNTLPPGSRAEFLRMALERAMEAGLMPELRHLQRVFGGRATSEEEDAQDGGLGLRRATRHTLSSDARRQSAAGGGHDRAAVQAAQKPARHNAATFAVGAPQASVEAPPAPVLVLESTAEVVEVSRSDAVSLAATQGSRAEPPVAAATAAVATAVAADAMDAEMAERIARMQRLNRFG